MKTLMTTLSVALSLAFLPNTGAAQNSATIARGAQLYGQNCLRCHSVRSPAERTDREWVTIVNHMRARANMRKSEAEAMTLFLQAINTPEASGTVTASAGVADPAASTGTASATVVVPRPAAEGPDASAMAVDAARTPQVSSVRDGEGGNGEAGEVPSLDLVVVDLADPELSPETRRAIAEYLEVIRKR